MCPMVRNSGRSSPTTSGRPVLAHSCTIEEVTCKDMGGQAVRTVQFKYLLRMFKMDWKRDRDILGPEGESTRKLSGSYTVA